ncbi:hypothetical protein GCM10009638_26740 [Luteococcus sanguinis]
MSVVNDPLRELVQANASDQGKHQGDPRKPPHPMPSRALPSNQRHSGGGRALRHVPHVTPQAMDEPSRVWSTVTP